MSQHARTPKQLPAATPQKRFERLRLTDRNACLLLALLCLVCFWPVFTGRVLVPAQGEYTFDAAFMPYHAVDARNPSNAYLTSDQVDQFYSWRHFTVSMYRAGRVPLWDPYAGCGTPFFAPAQPALFDPTNFALNFFLQAAYTQTIFMMFCLLLAVLGTYGLVRSLGGDPLGGVVAAISFGLGGFLLVWLGYPLAMVAAWLPALLLATHRFLSKPSVLRALGVALVLGALLLAGHPTTGLQVLSLWACFVRAGMVRAPSRASLWAPSNRAARRRDGARPWSERRANASSPGTLSMQRSGASACQQLARRAS